MSPNPRRRSMLPYVLIAPLVALIAVLSFYPTIATVIQAFFRISPLDPPSRFNGLQNFRDLFSSSTIREAWVNTALYVAVGVVLSVVLGLGIAISLRHRFRFRGIVLALVVLPWALPAVVEAIIWNWMYDANYGVVNSALRSLHITHSYGTLLGVNRPLTVVLIELVQVWQITPLSVLIILAALQSVPRGLYEAARIDGATAWQAFRHVSLPFIRSAIAVSAVQALVLSLNIFDQVYVMNGNAPLGSSVMQQTYNVTFQDLNFGEGYALSLVVTIASAVLSLGVLALLYRRVEEAA